MMKDFNSGHYPKNCKCGSEPTTEHDLTKDPETFEIQCETCGRTTGDIEDYNKAVKIWNEQ